MYSVKASACCDAFLTQSHIVSLSTLIALAAPLMLPLSTTILRAWTIFFLSDLMP